MKKGMGGRIEDGRGDASVRTSKLMEYQADEVGRNQEMYPLYFKKACIRKIHSIVYITYVYSIIIYKSTDNKTE